jgi:hypothetical protein
MNISAGQRGGIGMQEKPFPDQSQDAASTATEPYWRKLIPRGVTEIVLLALVVLVISLHLKYLLDVRTAVPHGDEWTLLDGMFRSIDEHQIGVWVFHPRNGHFLVPGTLGYLLSWRYGSLDLTPLRLLNFPICLAAFLLTAHVINAEIRSRFLRFYLYLGVCFVVFNLCFWELFSMGYMFTAMLSALFGGIGLYFIAKATQRSSKWKNHLLVGLCFLIASVLSLGAGYAATAAAISLLAFAGLKKLISRPVPRYETVVYCLACALGLLAIASHPFFFLRSRITQTVFHSVLVAGSAGSSFLDINSVTAPNVAFFCGVILFGGSLAVGVDFLIRRTNSRLLPVFSLALVLFGLFGCATVAVSRSNLSTAEFLSSRYTLYPSICLLGILLYFACSRIFWLTNMWCFAAAVYLLAMVREKQVAPFRPSVYQKIEVAMMNIDNLSDQQLRATLYWRENTKGVRRVVARMRRDRLNVFRGTPDTNKAPH